MSDKRLVVRFRQLLLILVACICLGTIVELWLTEHMEEPLQWIPFVLCIVGLVSLGLVWLRPQRWTVWTMRVVMLLVGLGSLLGTYLHLARNFEFELEIRPNAEVGDVVMEALSGANPLLAPGILLVGAILA